MGVFMPRLIILILFSLGISGCGSDHAKPTSRVDGAMSPFGGKSETAALTSSGIIAPDRAMDWSGAGVPGGIPARTTVCATLSPGATATQINSAISACPAGQVVMLNAGTYTLSSGIIFNRSNITLRGAGADRTKLHVNGTSSGCGLFYNSAIRMCAASANIGSGGGSQGGPGPDHVASWTGGYAKGNSAITLSDTTGLQVGSTIYLDQLNDSSDGYPASGDIYMCEGTSPCSNEGGNSYARPNRVQVQISRVTAINGNSVTVSPAVYLPNFRASQSPGAWWANPGNVLQNSGIEDMSVDFTGGGQTGIEMVNNTGTWVRGVRMIFNGGPGSFVFHVLVVNGFRVTIKDNYLYGPTVQGNTQYAFAPHVSGSFLFENNILHRNVSAITPNDPVSGSVYAYNFVTGTHYTGPGVILHNAGDMMNLYEGNNMSSFHGDSIHGTHVFGTLFRNHLDGYANNPATMFPLATAILLQANNRFFNLVGNVLGDAHFDTYQVLENDNGDAIYGFGWEGWGGGTYLSTDPNVARTTLRWGNYDTVTRSARFDASEVPSGIRSYANQVPASQSLPASLYLSAKPSYFGSRPWPPIGPDVSGGDVSGYSGHAFKIPARACFEGLATDSSYSSGLVKVFNANSCFGAGSGPAPSPTPVVTTTTTTSPPGTTITTQPVVSQKFQLGDRVVATTEVLARSSPSFGGAILELHPAGSLGIVIGGPQTADGLNWWNINYDGGADGWSTEDRLEKTESISTTTSTTTSTTLPLDTTPPSASITSPANGATVLRKSVVAIEAQATDNAGVTRVEFFVNGSIVCSGSTGPYSCSWSVPGVRNREYRLQTQAYDASGNVGQSAIVRVISR
jgi:hypothetical protein